MTDTTTLEQHFYPSRGSQLARSRRWLWLSAPLSMAYIAYVGKGSAGSMLISAAFVLLVFALIDMFLRRQMGDGLPLVTLNDAGIHSSLLPGQEKRIAWTDITGLSLTAEQGAKQLRFALIPSPARPNRRSFWNGANPAQPALLLTAFDTATQEALLQAIRQRLAASDSPAANQADEMRRELDQENAFEQQLKALAPIPWLTWLLVAANIGIWLVTLQLGGGMAHSAPDKLLVWGGNTASAVQAGEWWRLLSATFLHSGLMHVAMNMIGLAAAGITVERIYGQRLYAIIYLGSGLLGSALSLHFAAQKAVSVGASGAVFGVTGALLVAVLQGFSKPGIDNAAHIGGLLGGCLLAWVLPEKFDLAHFVRTASQRAAVALGLALAGTAAIAAFAPPAPINLQQAMASRQHFSLAMDRFNQVMQDIQKDQKTYNEQELNERGRTIYAPALRRVLSEFEQVVLPDNDARQPLVKDMRRTTALMLELLEMPDINPPDGGKPQPADPARAAAIEAELKTISERVAKLSDDLKKKGK